jgi:FkbM family methyltransferase
VSSNGPSASSASRGNARSTISVLRYVWTHPANRSTRVASVIRSVRFQARGRILRKRTAVPIGDRSKLWAELHWTASSRAAYSNPPDVEMLVWKRWLRPGDLFVDVGANVGIYSIFAAERDARVIAVEPDPDTAARLQSNADLNRYSIEVLECALAERLSTESFTVGLDCLNHFADLGSPGVRQVAVRTLDDIIGQDQVRGVKIDVEGSELRVLQGAELALRERRIDLLQIEWPQQVPGGLHVATPVARYLAGFGYTLWKDDGEGSLEPLTTQEQQRDVFARAPGGSDLTRTANPPREDQ